MDISHSKASTYSLKLKVKKADFKEIGRKIRSENASRATSYPNLREA